MKTKLPRCASGQRQETRSPSRAAATWFPFAVLIVSLLSSSAWAADPTTAPAGGDRMAAVGQLLFQSSASRQVTENGGPEALAKYQEAKEAYEQAREAERGGDAEAKKRLLEAASRRMFEAVRLAKPESVVGDKKRADFAKRLDSLNQLIEAHQRVRKEKKSDAGKAEIDGPVRENVAKAKSLFEAGKLDEARAALDEAYARAKAAMEELHGGDTVVRSLNFGSRQDEYRYELDRNETHRILLNGVLGEKADRPELEQQVRPFVDRAGELRKQAEEAAAKDRYEDAIEIIEESTAQLIRAIRAAGVFIPG